MICRVEDLENSSVSLRGTSFNNLDFIDTDPAFKKARESIEFFIPEFIRYISGDRTKSKVYGNIRKYYPEELIFMNNNILDNIDDLKNIDTIIENSCSLYKNLRIVILKEDISLTNITGYDILSFNKNGIFINTVFIQDMKVDTKLAFNMCLKLFDNILLNTLYHYNIPVYCSKYVPMLYDGNNGFKVSKFIIDYFYELLLPFVTKISVEKEEIEELAYLLSKSNFQIMSEEELVTLYKFIKEKQKGVVDDFDYIGIIMKYQAKLEKNELMDDGDYGDIG